MLLIAAGVICVAVLLVLFLVNRHQEQEFQKQLELGYRYLDQGNYEEAILAFKAAIDIRPKNGESYEGLANAYLELGDIDSALDALENGADRAQDKGLKEWLAAMQSMSGTATLQGTVLEYLPGGGSAPLAGASIRIYAAEIRESRLLRVATTDLNGAFHLTDLGSGTVTLHVEAEGHLELVTTETLLADTANYTELYLLIPTGESEESNYNGAVQSSNFRASVTNAINGEYVPGAEVRLRQGWNNTDGTLATNDVVIADDYGYVYVQDLNIGYYTAEIRADGFITSYHNVSIVPQEFSTSWSLTISPRLAEGETRIVLTWGELPRDLDAHLYNSDFHVYYGNHNYYQNGEVLAGLDWDDRSGYGPETITVYQSLSNDCTYYVRDFTNGGYSDSTQLSASGATVRVYQTDGLVATFHVPTGFAGYMWNVFTLTADGSIIPINTIGSDDIMENYYW